MNKTTAINEFQQVARTVLQGSGALIPGEEEFNQTLIQQFVEQLQLRIGSELLEMLDDAAIAEYDSVAQSEDSQVIQQFFQKHVPDFSEKVEGIVREFVQEYLAA